MARIDDERMPWYASVGAGLFVLIAVAGIALVMNRSEWGSAALQEIAAREARTDEQRRQDELLRQQQRQEEEARLEGLRQSCIARHGQIERDEAERYGWYLQRRPMDCETNRAAWAMASPSTDRSISTLHYHYQQLRQECAPAIGLPDRLNGRTQQEADYINCYGRPPGVSLTADLGVAPDARPVRTPAVPPRARPPPPQALPPPPELGFADIVWREQASDSDMERAAPRQARPSDYPARVRLRCRIGRDGQLFCRILSEDPPGAGFGQAALRLVRSYRAAPRTRSGMMTAGAEVEVPVRFDPPEQ